MPRHSTSRVPPLNWELLRRVAARVLAARGQGWFMALGLLVPLALLVITLLRPFDPRRMNHSLEQLAIWLAGFYCAFTLLYVLGQWLGPQLFGGGGRRAGKQTGPEDAELPLPVSGLQLFLHRCLAPALMPLWVLLLSLPLWLAACLYIQLPYGEQWRAEELSYPWFGEARQALWLAKLAWLALCFIGAVLLPLAWAILLQETYSSRALRCVLLLLPVPAVYAANHLYPELLRAPYQQTRGYDPLSFLAPILLLLGGALLIGLRPPAWRTALLITAALFLAGLSLLPALIDSPLSYGQRRFDAPLAARWLLLHASPPQNARLILHSWTSNVVLQDRQLLHYPAYPRSGTAGLEQQMYELQSTGTAPDDEQLLALQDKLGRQQAADSAAYDDYWMQLEQYETQHQLLPRLPLIAGAVLLPLLLPLLLLGGLSLAAARRPAAEA